MQCERVRDLLPDYSVELLDRRTHLAVEAHLTACPDCRGDLRALESVVALVERHGLRQPPPGLFQGVRNRIEAGQAPRQQAPWWLGLFGRSARAMAMGLALAGVAWGFLMPVQSTRLPGIEMSSTPAPAGPVTTSALADSIRQHALTAAEGPLTDRVAWEAMAQLVTQEREQERERRE